MKGGAFTTQIQLIVTINYQLSAFMTLKSPLECSDWPPQMKEKDYLTSLNEGRHGCAHFDVIPCSSNAN